MDPGLAPTPATVVRSGSRYLMQPTDQPSLPIWLGYPAEGEEEKRSNRKKRSIASSNRAMARYHLGPWFLLVWACRFKFRGVATGRVDGVKLAGWLGVPVFRNQKRAGRSPCPCNDPTGKGAGSLSFGSWSQRRDLEREEPEEPRAWQCWPALVEGGVPVQDRLVSFLVVLSCPRSSYQHQPGVICLCSE